MAKSFKTKVKEKRRKDEDDFVKQAMGEGTEEEAESPKEQNEPKKAKQRKNLSLVKEVKKTRSQELEPSSEEKQEPQVFEPYEKCNFTIPESVLNQLEDVHSDYRKEYRKKAPNKNHYVVVALRRLFKDMEGEESEEILKELLALRQETIERKKPKGPR